MSTYYRNSALCNGGWWSKVFLGLLFFVFDLGFGFFKAGRVDKWKFQEPGGMSRCQWGWTGPLSHMALDLEIQVSACPEKPAPFITELNMPLVQDWEEPTKGLSRGRAASGLVTGWVSDTECDLTGSLHQHAEHKSTSTAFPPPSPPQTSSSQELPERDFSSQFSRVRLAYGKATTLPE